MMREAVAAPNTDETAGNLSAPPLALLSAAAALPHLLKSARAAAPARQDGRTSRQRHLWGRGDGFTMAGMRR